MKKEVGGTIVFPYPASHRLDAGGGGAMEIKHIHPKHATEEERREQLANVRRTCTALLCEQRRREAQCEGKGA